MNFVAIRQAPRKRSAVCAINSPIDTNFVILILWSFGPKGISHQRNELSLSISSHVHFENFQLLIWAGNNTNSFSEVGSTIDIYKYIILRDIIILRDESRLY